MFSIAVISYLSFHLIAFLMQFRDCFLFLALTYFQQVAVYGSCTSIWYFHWHIWRLDHRINFNTGFYWHWAGIKLLNPQGSKKDDICA